MPGDASDANGTGDTRPEDRRPPNRTRSRSTRFGAAIYEFFHRLSRTPLATNAADLLDQVLLALILVEIVHTVVLSLRAHALVPQPFIVVGLVAVIRKLLFVLGNQQSISDTRLWIYIVMVAVFVTSLVAVSRFTSGSSSPP